MTRLPLSCQSSVARPSTPDETQHTVTHAWINASKLLLQALKHEAGGTAPIARRPCKRACRTQNQRISFLNQETAFNAFFGLVVAAQSC
eukprot:810896-Pleurochrysis_carterae.AAC.2